MSIASVSGDVAHKSIVTLTGDGFGAKPTAAPMVWDDCSGDSMALKWDGAWPNCGNADYFLRYREPQRGIALPHNHIARYMAGAHGGEWLPCGFTGGPNVVFWKNITIPSFPQFFYASWYHRMDDAWVFNAGETPDNNCKTFAYSNVGGPYEIPNNWYLNYAPPHPNSLTDIAQWSMNDDADNEPTKTWQNPDINGHNNYWELGKNPMTQWVRVDLALRIDNTTAGYLRVWEDGVRVVNYAGPTDRYPGNQRSIGIGGYARGYGQPNNWRYFADAYMDMSLARVVLANDPDLSRATIIENQIPQSWADGSLAVKINKGRFQDGDTAHLIVVDPTGAPQTGYAVAVGAPRATIYITPELSAKYNLDTSGTTLIGKRTDDWAEEIGDSKQTIFYPQNKLMRWGNECNVSHRLLLADYTPDELSCATDRVQYRKGNLIARYRNLAATTHLYEHGGMEADHVLLARPVTNVLRFSLVDKAVQYLYQPFLTAAERAAGIERPPEVEGSYAVYAVGKANNQYTTGKICHIFRPQMTDANGVQEWCELSIANGEMTITMPQPYLDSATYPVRVA